MVYGVCDDGKVGSLVRRVRILGVLHFDSNWCF